MEKFDSEVCNLRDKYPQDKVEVEGSRCTVLINYQWLIAQLEYKTGRPLPTEIYKAIFELEKGVYD